MTVWTKILIVVAILSLLFGVQKIPEIRRKMGSKKGKKLIKKKKEEEEETEEGEEKEEESSGNVCPICGEEFKSERGMKIHKGKAH